MTDSPTSKEEIQSPALPARQTSPILRWSLIGAGAVGLYALAGFVAVPALIKSRLPEFAEQTLKRKASLGEIRINPFTLRVEARDFKLTEADGRPIVSLSALVADLEWSSLTRRAWHLAEIRLTEPKGLLDIAPDGRINLAELLADLTRDAPKQTSRELPRLKIDSFVLERGRADFSDRRAGYSNALTPIDLKLDNFSTLPQDKGPYAFSANTLKGGVLRWKGEVSMNPIAASGRISGETLSLPDLAVYLKPYTTAEVSDGKLGFELPYRLAYRDGKLDASVDGAALSLNLLAVKAPGAAEPLFALTNLKADKVTADYAKREMVVGEVALDGGKMMVKRDAKGDLDLLALVKLPQDLEAPALAAAAAEQFATVTNAKSSPAAAAGGAGSGGAVATAATAGGSGIPATPEIWKARVDQFSLDNFALAFEDKTAAAPLSAVVERFKLKAAASAQTGTAPKVMVKGVEVGLHNLLVGAKSAPPLRIGDISITGGELDLAARSVKVANVNISDGQIKLVRNKQGRINLLDLVPGAGSGSAASAPSKPASGTAPLTAMQWKALAGAVLLGKFTVDAEDQDSGIALRAQDISAKLTGVSNDLKQPFKFDAGLTLREGGKFTAEGSAILAQASVEANVKLDQLALKPVQPLLARFIKLKLAGGAVSAQGKVSVAAAGGKAPVGKAPVLRYSGGFSVADLKLDEETGELFAAWKRAGSEQLTLTLQPNLLEVPELRIDEINAKLLINQDRSLNAMRLLVNQPAAAASAGAGAAAIDAPASGATPMTAPAPASTAAPAATLATATPADELFPVNLRRVRVQNGKLDFADLSLRPQFGAKIHELSGVINGLSTSVASRSQLELDGRVDEFGLARIRGELNPFVPRNNTEVSVVFKNIDLVSASPYSMKFAGYKIASGKISLDLNYKVRNSQLEGKNSMILDQLTLGERVDSPDAIKLPLELALAILKDADGKIDLDLPVSGSLDDPQFSYGAVVWKAVLNVIGKIVTAPFRALGAMFGFSGDKLESIDFDAGSAVLLPPEKEKLKQVAAVLSKRAQLKLAAPAAYNEAADGAALRVRAVRLETAKRAGIRVADDEEPGPPDLQDRSVRGALRALLTERHGAAEWDTRKAEAEKNAAGAPVSMFERATRVTQGDPQVADLAPFYRGLIERLNQSQTLPADALTQLAQRRSDAVAEALKGAGVDAARIAQPGPEKTDAASGKPVPLKLGLSSR